jgi:undecaprenyl-diphosphatase
MTGLIDRLLALDRAAFLAVNGGWHTPALDVVMVFVSLLGNGLFLAGVVGLSLFLGDRRRFAARFPVIVAAVLVGAAVTGVIKEIVARPRPPAEFAEEIRTGAVWVHTVFEHWRANSFPSGHAQAAFGAAAALTWYYRGWYTLPVFVLAGSVAVSRVYLGVHFPLDVAAGALVGVGCAVSVCRIWGAVRARRGRQASTRRSGG